VLGQWTWVAKSTGPENYILAVDFLAAFLVDFAVVAFFLVDFAGASAANDTEPRTRPRPRAMLMIFFIMFGSP